MSSSMWLLRTRGRRSLFPIPPSLLSLNYNYHRAFPRASPRAFPQTSTRTFSSSTIFRAQGGSRRPTDWNAGYTSTYDPNEEGRGPMFSKTSFGVPQFYPRDLKRRVDEYVVGQDRAKKIISSVLFNHYQGLRRRQYYEEQERKREERLFRQAVARERNAREREAIHPVEDEFPGHRESLHHMHQSWHQREDKEPDFYIPEDESRPPPPVKIDKSNLLLLGPTGVGKTYILETLSKTINVPFTISDCNSFTQAGYIGQDVETCIERLLIEADYDIKAAEHGIVVLDEFDKIAKRETVNGRDVGGEGVQQALLKLIEGTKVTVNVKDTRSSTSSSSSRSSASPITTNYTGAGSSTTSSAHQQPPMPPPPGMGGVGGMGAGARVEQYTIDTSNILFVMCGAFVGLDKVILNRVAKPTMGFGSELRRRGDSMAGDDPELPTELFKHLPHRSAHPALADVNTAFAEPSTSTNTTDTPTTSSTLTPPSPHHTALDLATPEDLQAYGFIPELIGRVHSIAALSPLSQSDLLRILTEPRNSLTRQYAALFETYPSRLRFTRRALRAIARRAERSRTGARGLRMEVERVLAEAVFDAPVPFVLVTEAAVDGAERLGYWGRDGHADLERRARLDDGDDDDAAAAEADGLAGPAREVVRSLGDYREAGQSGA